MPDNSADADDLRRIHAALFGLSTGTTVNGMIQEIRRLQEIEDKAWCDRFMRKAEGRDA